MTLHHPAVRTVALAALVARATPPQVAAYLMERTMPVVVGRWLIMERSVRLLSKRGYLNGGQYETGVHVILSKIIPSLDADTWYDVRNRLLVAGASVSSVDDDDDDDDTCRNDPDSCCGWCSECYEHHDDEDGEWQDEYCSECDRCRDCGHDCGR